MSKIIYELYEKYKNIEYGWTAGSALWPGKRKKELRRQRKKKGTEALSQVENPL